MYGYSNPSHLSSSSSSTIDPSILNITSTMFTPPPPSPASSKSREEMLSPRTLNERRVATFLRGTNRLSRYSKSPAQIEAERRRDQQRIQKRVPSSFQLRAPAKMARAALSSTAMSRERSFTTTSSTESTPALGLDSGYISGISPYSSPTTQQKPHGPSMQQPSSATPPSTTTPQVSTVADYHGAMAQLQDGVFGVCYVNKQFTYDSRAARAQLAPVMRAALDLPEDRPTVTKYYLRLDFKNRRIQGFRRTHRLKRSGGAPNTELRRLEGPDYINVRGYHNNRY
ncbi:hypothetical protein EDC01DRAFT_349379 [Geopyxis carbonaria]|nr:hypothetical protein EDC01DRAFT_349379 [Geopyxis carbonaria]